MKKILILTTIAVATTTLAACSSTNEQTNHNTTLDNTTVQTDTGKEAPTQKLVASTNYMTYDADKVQQAQKAGKNVGLFFHSASCGSCAKLDQDITQNTTTIPNDVVIYKVDRDAHQDLAKQYNVNKYHTVRFLDQDTNITGVFTLEGILNQKKQRDTASEKTQKINTPKEEEKTEKTQQQPANTSEKTTQKKQDPKPQKTTLKPYETYSTDKRETAKQENKKIVLNFKASRCPTCKATTANIINNINKLPNNVVILEADYDTYTDLKKKYGVIRQTTFVIVDENGSHQTVETIRSIDDLLNSL